jgi:hypothetical protein
MTTPAERRLRSQIGAHKSWSRCKNRSARTLPARLALEAKFERRVDPDKILLPAERAKRAQNARKAFYAGLALKSAQARPSAWVGGVVDVGDLNDECNLSSPGDLLVRIPADWWYRDDGQTAWDIAIGSVAL